jgi:hypothetical protein
MLNVTLVGDKEVIQRFASLPERAHRALVAEVTTLALELQAHVVQDKLQGQVLNHITGRLQSSIQHDVQSSGTTVAGRVYANTSTAPYAGAQEFGATIPDRYPVNAKAMHWTSGGQDVFAKFARGFNLPERSYLRSSLEDYKERIISGMTNAVKQAMVA